jgi:hypothetical protein
MIIATSDGEDRTVDIFNLALSAFESTKPVKDIDKAN